MCALTACEHVFAIDHGGVTAVFIACACDVHSTFEDLIVAERARPCRRGQGGSFRCISVSTASVRKGAMTKRRASTATLFSQQNEERRVQSHRFFWSLGIRERNQWKEPASKIDQQASSFDVRKMLGCCGQITRR